MQDYPQPRIVISRCLGFESCRYNDQVINDPFVRELREFVDPITPCPEADMGLGVPRFPVRLVRENDEMKLKQPETERDLTEEFNNYCNEFFEQLPPVDGFIVKYRSPTCGQKAAKIYHTTGKEAPVDTGPGMFSREIIRRRPDIPLEDEGRLKNYRLRYQFYSNIFTLARFRKIKENPKMKKLVDFHSRHKFLLMAHDEEKMRQLGRICANEEGQPVGDVFENYEELLRKNLAGESTRKTNINVLQHMSGYFSETNSSREKDYFEQSLDLYREQRIPLSSVLSIINSWALRDENDYLLNQYYLKPFPRDLLELKDSGREIEL